MKKRPFPLACSMVGLALTAIQGVPQSVYTQYTFTTLAGNTGYGSADGTGSAARFAWPSGVAVDSAGNAYVADTGNNTIRKVTPAGVVTTLAGLAGSVGSADGTGSAARFNQPYGVAVDGAGNVYVGDTLNSTIRKVTPEGMVTTLAGLAGSEGNLDGTGSAARFAFPSGVAVDGAGIVYVGDTHNRSIRKVTPAGGVTTLAAGFDFLAPYYPSGGGVAVDTADNVYVADQGNQTIRKVTPDGVVTTLAGVTLSSGYLNGTGSVVRFSWPAGVAVDSAGNVYVGDTGNNAIRKVTPTGVVTTLAAGFKFWTPYGSPSGGGVAVDRAGNVFVADTMNNTIRKVTPAGLVTTLAGLGGSSGSANGTQSVAGFNFAGTPYAFPSGGGVAVDSAGNLFVADTDNNTIRKVTPTGVVTTLAGLPGSSGTADGLGSTARFYAPSGVAVDSTGNLYVADTWNNMIRKVTPTGVVTTLAGLANSSGSTDGTSSAARFLEPNGVAVDSTGNVYVADTRNSAIRKVTSGGVVTTLAGGSYGSVDGVGSAAQFNRPYGVAVDGAGNVYVADTWNSTIRKVTPEGVVTTLAGLAGSLFGSADGTGSAARFWIPHGVALDSGGNVYVADSGNHTIRKVTPTGAVTTLAGGSYGSTDGTGSAARFAFPSGVAVDNAGNVYVADTFNDTIRKGYPGLRILKSGTGFGFNGTQFGFDLTLPAVQSVVVEASTDLVNWVPLLTNTLGGTVNFGDPQWGVYSNRFYRAHLP